MRAGRLLAWRIQEAECTRVKKPSQIGWKDLWYALFAWLFSFEKILLYPINHFLIFYLSCAGEAKTSVRLHLRILSCCTTVLKQCARGHYWAETKRKQERQHQSTAAISSEPQGPQIMQHFDFDFYFDFFSEVCCLWWRLVCFLSLNAVAIKTQDVHVAAACTWLSHAHAPPCPAPRLAR